MGPRRQDVLHAALVVAVVAAVVLIAPPGARGAEATPAWALPYDDPYIHLRYAQALVQGVPGQWSAGAPSTGATSPLYGLLLAPWVALTDDLALLSWAARGTGAACLVWAGAARKRCVCWIGGHGHRQRHGLERRTSRPG